MRTAHRMLIFTLALTTIILFTYAYNQTFTGNTIQEYANVTRVIDGDTIEINGNQKVRLLDINTPEKSQPYYSEAVEYLKAAVEGKTISLEKGKEDRDKYDRLLRYVFYKDIFMNEAILKEGLATFYSYQETKYTEQLKEAETFAKEYENNLWEKSTHPCVQCIVLINIDTGKGKDDCLPKTESITFKNTCTHACNLEKWTLKDEANHIYTFKSYLNSQQTLTLYNGEGADNPPEYYYQNKGCASIWNDEGDALFLRDEQGKLVIYSAY